MVNRVGEVLPTTRRAGGGAALAAPLRPGYIKKGLQYFTAILF